MTNNKVKANIVVDVVKGDNIQTNIVESNLQGFKTEEISNLKVSKRTSRYIHLLDKVTEMWGEITDVLDKDYGYPQGEDLFNKDFAPSLEKIRGEIEVYIIDSIKDNMSRDKKTEVL